MTRTVLGLSFEDGVHVACLGERVWSHDTRSLREGRDGIPGNVRTERMWVVLDEAHGHLAEDVFAQLVSLKDRYLCSVLYAPNKPTHLAESMRATEGLAYYLTDSVAVAEGRWPTFRPFATRAGVYLEAPPDEETVHRDLEHFATTPVRDPATSEPILALDGSSAKQLMIPGDFPTQTLAAGFQQGALGPCQSLWFAVHGLARSRSLHRVADTTTPKDRPFVQAGY